MTSKSKRKDNKGASKKMDKGALKASVQTISHDLPEASAHEVGESPLGVAVETISHGPLAAPADAVKEDAPERSAGMVSYVALNASSHAVSEGVPGATSKMMSSGYANTGELRDKVTIESTTTDAQGSRILQNLFQGWFEFAGMRMRQHMHLFQAIQECRSLPDLQQAYSQFWQNAYTQYSEETQRMLLITHGAVDGVSRAAHENGAPNATLH